MPPARRSLLRRRGQGTAWLQNYTASGHRPLAGLAQRRRDPSLRAVTAALRRVCRQAFALAPHGAFFAAEPPFPPWEEGQRAKIVRNDAKERAIQLPCARRATERRLMWTLRRPGEIRILVAQTCHSALVARGRRAPFSNMQTLLPFPPFPLPHPVVWSTCAWSPRC